MFFNHILERNIVLEAKKKASIKPDADTSDYSDTVDDTADTDTTDHTDTEEDTAPDPDAEDTGDTDEDADTTDYTDDDTDSTDDPDSTDDNMDGTDDTTEDELPDAKKNSLLIKDFITLYQLIENTIERLADIKKGDILISSIIIQVTKNLTLMEKQLFNFIQTVFTKNTYINNLYQYNYFIEALKINIEMLKKIKQLNKV